MPPPHLLPPPPLPPTPPLTRCPPGAAAFDASRPSPFSSRLLHSAVIALLAIDDGLGRDKVDTRGGTKEVEHEAPLPVEARCRLLEHEGVAEVGECPNDRVPPCHRVVAQLGQPSPPPPSPPPNHVELCAYFLGGWRSRVLTDRPKSHRILHASDLLSTA